MATGGHTGAITQKMGSFASAVPDGYSGRSPLSDHATPPSLATSGQPSSTTSFVDTKTERLVNYCLSNELHARILQE